MLHSPIPKRVITSQPNWNPKSDQGATPVISGNDRFCTGKLQVLPVLSDTLRVFRISCLIIEGRLGKEHTINPWLNERSDYAIKPLLGFDFGSCIRVTNDH